MRYILFTLVTTSLFILACGQKEEMKMEHKQHANEAAVQMAEEQFIYYTCPMDEHKHIHSAESGKCTECNMELVQAVVTSKDKMDFYGCPMEAHSHVRTDKLGTCADCGMELKPMRLKKS